MFVHLCFYSRYDRYDADILQAAKDVRASHDVLVDLFERVQFFLKRLGVHAQISPTEDMVEILVKIMAEIISILSITTKEMQQSGASRLFLLDTLISIWPILDSMIPLETYLKKLMGGKDIEDALKRLDNLTREEFQMAIAQVLKAMNQLTDGAQPH